VPELPEVEHLRLSLIPRLVGRMVRDVRVIRRDVVITPGDPAGGFARSAGAARPRRLTQRSMLAGGRIVELKRIGKQLAIITADDRALCVHLGMTGQLRWSHDAAKDSEPHIHIAWRLDDGSSLSFRDPRRFGGIWTFPSSERLIADRWSLLGPDALTIDAVQLAARLAGRRCAIKAALLDQSIVAGIGNIYADEALFAARLSPIRPAGSLKTSEASALVSAVQRILHASIAAGGSTLRDYVDGEGTRGENQRAFLVYGRAGSPCTACNAILISRQVAQRTTVWCPACQGFHGTRKPRLGRKLLTPA
jgi:formamidopyrimidine-DNA glycosylase